VSVALPKEGPLGDVLRRCSARVIVSPDLQKRSRPTHRTLSPPPPPRRAGRPGGSRTEPENPILAPIAPQAGFPRPSPRRSVPAARCISTPTSVPPLRSPSTDLILPKQGRKNSWSSVRWLLSTRLWYTFHPSRGSAESCPKWPVVLDVKLLEMFGILSRKLRPPVLLPVPLRLDPPSPKPAHHQGHKGQPVQQRRVMAIREKPETRNALRMTGFGCPPGPAGTALPLPRPDVRDKASCASSSPSFLLQMASWNVLECPLWESQDAADVPSSPAFLLVEDQHLFLHLRWGAAGIVVRPTGSIHQACFVLSKEAPNPLPHRIAGDVKSSGRFPVATTVMEAPHDLQSDPHFALLVGEVVSFCEGECQQGGIPPFMLVWMNLRIGGMPHLFKKASNAERSGLRAGSPSLGGFTSVS